MAQHRAAPAAGAWRSALCVRSIGSLCRPSPHAAPGPACRPARAHPSLPTRTRLHPGPRHRISGGEIKDKSDLLEARKDIERRMERFKICEKEAKTKAFSKEGLGAASRLDPKERQKQEMRDWLSQVVDTLDTQVGAGGSAGVGMDW